MDPTSNPFELLSDEGQKKLVKNQQPAKKEDKKAAPAGKATTAATSALSSKPKGKPEAPVKQGPKNPIAVPTFEEAPRTQRGGRGGRGGRGRGGRGVSRSVQTGRKREFDHHVSGTGRPINEVKRDGRGKGNWGGKTEEGIDAQAVADEVTHNTEHKEETAAAAAAAEETTTQEVVQEEPDTSVIYADFEAEQQKKAEELKKLLGGNREIRKPEAVPDFGKNFHKLGSEEEDSEEEGSGKKAKKAAQRKTPKEIGAEQLGFTSPPLDRERRGGRRGGRGGRGGRGAARGGNQNRGAAAPRRGGAFDATENSNKYESNFPSLSGK